MSIKHKAIRGAAWSAIQNWGSQIGSLLIFFILARLLSPEAFGLVALANVFLAFMQLFSEQGFGHAIIQRQNLEPGHLDTAFWINLTIGLFLAVISVSIATPIAGLFGQPALTPILRWFSILFVISALGKVQQSILERQFEYRAIAARWLMATVVGGAVGITMALMGAGVWSLVGQQIVHEAVGTLTLWLCSDWRPRLSASRVHFRDLFGVGMPIMGFHYLNFFSTRANDFLVGYAFTPADLGFYSVANRVLYAMTQLLVQTSRDVALPTFSRLQEDPERFRRAFYLATQVTSAIALPSFLGMAVLAPELVRILFGEQWLPSVPLIQVLALLGILRSITFFKGSVFVAMGKPAWWFWLSVLDVVLNLLAFAVAYRWGIFAVAAASVIRAYLVFPIGQWAVCHLIQDSLGKYLRVFISPLICALAMAGAMLGLKTMLGAALGPLFLIVVSTGFGAAFYVALIRLLAPQLFGQLMDIAQVVVSKSNPPTS
ncbi:lipopolysaccharide biosynthesis protein [Nodosilinea sp. E11]|uniref:lipopolysaccharide biosynthesis protein n=1 Tax=Nodosilinea sp. E11 TaxID=3037479 RepID=UPI0029343D35|nr:lipopolysaccharide biosynthesis protein [Nodosilinea sp. E11]WOD38145.1 lipopolysaccharide biosynthesis protein [Nodosilinea sp. E11]